MFIVKVDEFFNLRTTPCFYDIISFITLECAITPYQSGELLYELLFTLCAAVQ